MTVGAYLLHAPAVTDRRYNSLKPQTQVSALLRSPLRLVRQIRTEPLFHFGYAHPLPIRVVFHLVALDFSDREIFRLGVREVEAAHRAGWHHGEAFGQSHPKPPSATRRWPCSAFTSPAKTSPNSKCSGTVLDARSANTAEPARSKRLQQCRLDSKLVERFRTSADKLGEVLVGRKIAHVDRVSAGSELDHMAPFAQCDAH